MTMQQVRAEEWIERAKKIGEIAEAEADEADRNGRFSDRVAQAIKDTEIQKLVRPRKYGGHSQTPRLFAEVIRTVGRYNLSAGWLTFFYPIHEIWVGYLHPEGRKEIFHDGGLVADVIAPVGRAERDGSGYRVYGRWNFASGILWAGWIGLGAIARRPEGSAPEPMLFAVRVSELKIIKNWDTLGLRATASHGVEADGVWVPDRRVLPYAEVYAGKPIGGEMDDDEPSYRVPFMPYFAYGFVALALAGAERLVEIFQEKTENRIRVYEGGAKEVEKREKQRLLGVFKAQLDAANALFERYLDQLDAWMQEGRTSISEAERNRMFAWRAQTIEMCADLARKVMNALGGTALYKGDPAERFVRDILMLSSHAAHQYEDAMWAYGATSLGLAGHPVW
ncbi:MAG: acyl-CoA dehydrogenase [Hydrogenibacillus schlegelii]|nr:acyl-CoA dehydrogenase [Hydrogenibacillus schlegelii]